MNRKIFKCLLGVSAVMAVVPLISAQQIHNGNARIENILMSRIDDKMRISLKIVPTRTWSIKSTQELTLLPSLSALDHRYDLPSVTIAGKSRYIYLQRNSAVDSLTYRASKAGSISYTTVVPYESWMDGASITFEEMDCGCLGTHRKPKSKPAFKAMGDQPTHTQYTTVVYHPVYAYMLPTKEAIKVRNETGSARIAFRLSRTDIDASYRNNFEELRKIVSTIATVRNNPNVSIREITLCGYASPEGSVRENNNLANSRTQSVAHYVRQHISVPGVKIIATSGGENWDGLIEYVRTADIMDKYEILSFLESKLMMNNLDAKELMLKETWPDAYRTLLRNCYPTLRRTDYSITYTVRAFNTNEAAHLIKTRPRELSLSEMYNIAQLYVPGSEEFNYVFDTAVKMFPTDESANVNAAISAMQRHDLSHAARYLEKAGEGGEATLARGILAMLNGDIPTAKALMLKAQAMGVDAAAANLRQLRIPAE